MNLTRRFFLKLGAGAAASIALPAIPAREQRVFIPNRKIFLPPTVRPFWQDPPSPWNSQCLIGGRHEDEYGACITLYDFQNRVLAQIPIEHPEPGTRGKIKRQILRHGTVRWNHQACGIEDPTGSHLERINRGLTDPIPAPPGDYRRGDRALRV